MAEFHPELRRTAARIPRISFTPGLARLVRLIQRLRGVPKPPLAPGVTIRDVMIPGPASTPRVRLYAPEGAAAPRPALLWIHGGGFIIGTPEQDQAGLVALCRELGMVVAAVAYRLGPKHPFPAGLDDSYTALRWLHGAAGQLGVDANRIAIGGSSAGAGLAAGLVQCAHDRGEVPLACQLLIYPMLDDRTTLRTDIDHANLRLWTAKSNALGWKSYLGREPGGADVPEYAAPARRRNLAGLPPAWIGVGTCDLFHDEDLDYARRLQKAGVDCTLKLVGGAFHGFELSGAEVPVVVDFKRSYIAFARRMLCGS